MAGTGCYATYNGVDFSYVALETDWKEKTVDGAVERYVCAMKFTSHFSYANVAAFVAGKAAIFAALSTPGQDFTVTDPNGTRDSILAVDVLGDGPIARYKIKNELGYTFDIEVEVSGDYEPSGGSGTPVDTYTDTYDYNVQLQRTYTRRGTQRVTTAYSNEKTALDGVDPTPGDGWHLLKRRGEFDEDMKGLKYEYMYIQVFENIPSDFKEVQYSVQRSHSGQSDEISVSGTVYVEYARDVSAKDLEDKAVAFARGKMPENAVITNISATANPVGGSCSFTVSGIAPAGGGDVIESSVSVTTARRKGFVQRYLLGGGGSWKQKTTDDIITISCEGSIVGLHGTPRVSEGGDVSSIRVHDPRVGPDGKYYYQVDYTSTIEMTDTEGVGGGTGGGRGGGSGSGPGDEGEGGNTPSTREVIQVGDIGGFSGFRGA